MSRINRKEELSEVAADMKALYEKMMKKIIAREFGDSLANVAGKRLKAVQLDLADDAFVQGKFPHVGQLSGLPSDAGAARPALPNGGSIPSLTA